MEVAQPQSFREALLNVPGIDGTDDIPFEEIADEDLPENRWYIEREEPNEGKIQVEGQIPEILVTDKELEEWSKDWMLTLVVHALGKRINYRMLENKANREWARSGTVKIIDLPRGFFAVHFSSPEDYKHVLFEGPWMIADHYLLVQRWRPNFLNSARKESKVAVWVRIPELALELYNLTFLKRLGGSLGTFLKMDRLTSIQSRGQFARFCVEIDLAKPLIPYVMLRGLKLKLEYEGLHSVCFKCGVYGHRMENCSLQNSSSPVMEAPPVHTGGVEKNQGVNVMGQGAVINEVGSKPSDVNLVSHVGEDKQESILEGVGDTMTVVQGEIPENDDSEGPFGPWMLVKRAKKKKGAQSTTPKAKKVEEGRNCEKGQSSAEVKALNSQADSVKSQSAKGKQGIIIAAGPRESGKVKSGPFTIFEDQAMKMDLEQGQQEGQGSNPIGGKQPHIGPRVRDAKKVARGNGSLKMAFKVAGGPNGSKKKDNRYSNVKGVEKGKLTILTGPTPPKAWSIQEKDLLQESLAVQTKKVTKLADPIQQPPVEDTNPLLGFITSTNVSKSKEPSSSGSQFPPKDGHPSGYKLSEQTPPAVSQ